MLNQKLAKNTSKAYEVTINGKTVWIAAPSKKVIREFFDRPKATSIYCSTRRGRQYVQH